MSVGTTSAILAAIVSLTVAIAILFRRPRRPLYQSFALFTLALFVWHGAGVADSFAGGELGVLLISAALLLPPAAVPFFRELLRDRSPGSLRLGRVTLIVSGLLMLATLTPIGGELPFRAVAAAYVIGTLALVLNGMYRRTKSAARSDEKKRLSFLFFGGFVTLVLTAGVTVPRGELLAAMGHIAATFYVYFLYQSILLRRLVDLVEILGKAAVLACLTVVLAGVYALLVLWVGQNQQGLWLFNTLVASFVILILYDQVRPWVEETTAKLMFRERYELRQVLRRLLRALRTTIALPEMRQQVLDALNSSGRASNVSIYLQVEGDPSFALYGYRGQKPPDVVSLNQQPTLFQELRRERRPLLLEQLLARQQELPSLLSDDPTLQREVERTGEAVASMRQLFANVVLPMHLEDRIVGLLCLGSEHLIEVYSTDELSALLSVAEACAIVIENSQEYEKHRERDRLVAIGEMAAGMAHEIRNPLGAIKGAAQCLDPQAIPKDAQEFVGVIVEEVDRLNGVVSQFLEYARPYRGNPIPVNVNDVVSATLKLLGKNAVPAGVTVQEELEPDLPQVNVDPEQLKQVLINLVQNAVQAMPKGGQVTVSTAISMRRSGDYAGGPRPTNTAHVVIRVRDNGVGIRPEDLPRIFVPFFTTKQSGTGLGLAISQRIVENSGGRLEVASRHGEGSTFTIRMPAVSSAPELEKRGDITDPSLSLGGKEAGKLAVHT